MKKIIQIFFFFYVKVQDLLFLNENEFISSGDVIFKESAEYALMVWDFETSAVLSNQIYHVCFKKQKLNIYYKIFKK